MKLPDKFLIHVGTQERANLVQERLFELGYTWHGDKELHTNMSYTENNQLVLCVEDSVRKYILYGSLDFCKSNTPFSNFPIITVNSLFE